MSSNVPLFGLAVLAVIGAVLSQTSPKSEEKWQASFDIIDSDGDKKISPKEFRETMQDMGWALTLEQQDAAFAQYDIDPAGDGFSFGEFKQMWFNTLTYSGDGGPAVPNDVRFAQLDQNGDGNFVFEELRSGSYIAGLGYNDVQLQAIFNLYDKYPQDGKINLCEFLTTHNGVTYD